MGTEQILRISAIRRLTLGLVVVVASVTTYSSNARAQQRQAAPAVPDEPVAIIDIRTESSTSTSTARSESRQAFVAELARFRGIALFPGSDGDPALAAALTGQSTGPAVEVPPDSPLARSPATTPSPAAETLTRLQAAYDRNDCAEATRLSEQAILTLAARQAAGDTGIDGLQRAYGYALLCAHGQGNTDLAIRARSQLERLGVTSAPPGVNDLVWNLYPALDATANSELIELTIVTIPPGGAIWLDHQKLGNSPVVAVASEGPHLVAVAMADGSRSTARAIAVKRGEGYDGDKQTLTLPVAEAEPAAPASSSASGSTPSSRAARAAAVAKRVASWRGGDPVDGQNLGPFMNVLQIRIAIVLSGSAGTSGKAEIWALGPGETQARQIGSYTMAEADSIARAIVKRVRRWELTGPTEGVELLRESPEERRVRGLRDPLGSPSGDGTRGQGPRWWVYATIIGAVAAGAAFILIDDLSSDRQRIELDLP